MMCFRVTDWIKQTRAYNMLPTETHFRAKGTHSLREWGWKKTFHANGNDKKAVVVTLIRQNRLKTKFIRKDKDGHYIMKKRINTRR